jgi:hypothetical protein
MMTFRHTRRVFISTLGAARQRMGSIWAFAEPALLFGIACFALSAILPLTPGLVGSGAVMTVAGAAEGPVAARPRSGEPARQGRCLSRQEQRARIAAHAAIPLGKAVRAIKGRGDLLRARLCERRGRLLYLVTILGHNGKVQRLAIDARTGRLVGSRH